MDDSASLATDKKMASNKQHVNNKVPALKKMPKLHGKDKGKWIEGGEPTSSKHMSNNVYNVQIPYDVNQAVNPESWDSKFNSILLYGSMEHLTIDINNIKESLYHIGKYILNKKKLNKIRPIALLT